MKYKITNALVFVLVAVIIILAGVIGILTQ